MNPHRRHFIDRALLYLFSIDIEFSPGLEQLGLVYQGARVNLRAVPDTARVYNVLRQRTAGGSRYPTLTGTLTAGADAALLREDDVGIANVRATISTDDGAVIDTVYGGVVPLGRGSFRAIVGETRWRGSSDEQAEGFPAVVTPTYETASSKYKWLTEFQCVGFGRVEVLDGVFRYIKYDIYGMT